MLHYKLERVLLVILWIAIIAILSVAIPPQSITPLVQYQYVVTSLFLVLLLFFIYRKVSNHIMVRKIKSFIFKNDAEAGLAYVSKAIQRQPRFGWLKVKKLELLFIKGDICGYQTFRTTLFCKDHAWMNYVDILDNVMGFLTQGKIDPSVTPCNLDIERSLLGKTNHLLCERDTLPHDTLMMLASTIYHSSIPIYRCIASLIMSMHYQKTGDTNNKTLYYEEAIRTAPSAGIAQCVKSICKE